MKLHCCWAMALTLPASAATLNAGPNEAYATPSQAIAAALPGDTVHIAAGTYSDCAVWRTDNLTIEGEGAATVLTDAVCGDQGILVVNAPHATVRNLTVSNAAIAEGNGSGIRDNSEHLIVENCTFRDNQDGILTYGNGRGELTVRNSTFEGNGACLPNKGCAHGIYAGSLGLVRIEGSRFYDTKVGHHIKSRARRTEVVNNIIEDGPNGTSSYLIDLPNGGALMMTGNTIQKGPRTQNPSAAVTIGEEVHVPPASAIVISGNTFRNDGPRTVFVRNMTKDPAQLRGNTVKGPAQVLSGPGYVD